MKTCNICYEPHIQPRSPFCVKCQRKLAHKKYCDTHKEKRYAYQEKYRKNNPDKIRETSKKSYCKKKGIPLIELRHKNKQGEGHLKKNGYRVLCKKNHPNACDAKGWIYEHTYIMAEYLGRPLHKGEAVHHKNGIRSDNRIENLELWNRSHPSGQRVEDKIKWAIEFLNQYGYKVTT